MIYGSCCLYLKKNWVPSIWLPFQALCAIDNFFHSNSLHGLRSHIYVEQFLCFIWYYCFCLLVYYIYFWRAIDDTKKLCFSKPRHCDPSLPNLFNWPWCSFFKGLKCIHQNSKVCPVKVFRVYQKPNLWVHIVYNYRACRM